MLIDWISSQDPGIMEWSAMSCSALTAEPAWNSFFLSVPTPLLLSLALNELFSIKKEKLEKSASLSISSFDDLSLELEFCILYQPEIFCILPEGSEFCFAAENFPPRNCRLICYC